MLADALEANDTLATLNLGYIGVDDNGAQRLARAVQYGAALTSLTLYENSITNHGTPPTLQNSTRNPQPYSSIVTDCLGGGRRRRFCRRLAV